MQFRSRIWSLAPAFLIWPIEGRGIEGPSRAGDTYREGEITEVPFFWNFILPGAFWIVLVIDHLVCMTTYMF